MAYSTSNPPKLIGKAVSQAGQIWEYRSTDAATVVDGSGYITNAKSLGMKVGDRVYVHDTDASPYTITEHVVISVNASTGAADLSNSDGTNSD